MDPWVVPAVSASAQVLKHQKEIRGLWGKLVARLLGPKSSIVVTGVSGVGKTVLLDHLTGEGLDRDYEPPGKSTKSEKGKLAHERQRLLLTVVPGQHTQTRFLLLDEVFNEKAPPDGVIFVVANGYIELRDPYAKQQLITQGIDTIEKFRADYLAKEVDALGRP